MVLACSVPGRRSAPSRRPTETLAGERVREDLDATWDSETNALTTWLGARNRYDSVAQDARLTRRPGQRQIPGGRKGIKVTRNATFIQG